MIAGWTVRYAAAALVGFEGDPGAYFAEIREGFGAFGFHVIFMGVTVAIVAGGFKSGIERVALVAMPALFALVCGIAIYAATLDGAGAGYDYYLNAKFENILSMDVVVSAAGQALFSLSLGMGAILTFASYLSADDDLPSEAGVIAGADFGVAFVAGLMVFPLIFAFGLQSDVGESTLGALFVALPKAFASMGFAGRVVGFAFFVALIVGALTSAISLLEVVVASLIDSGGWSRANATLGAGGAITALGGLSAWNIGVLDVMDQVANNFFLIGGGLCLSIFAGWVMEDPVGEAGGGSPP